MNQEAGVRSRKRKRRNNRRKTETTSTKLNVTTTATRDADLTVKQQPSSSTVVKSSSKPSSFLEKMKAKLSGGHFRMINEKLYTCSGEEALNYFKEDPSLFNMYHTGYQEQMSRWPEQPVNIIMKWLKDQNSSLVVADFGCGDARLAKGVKNKVFSIDLVSNDPSVIACDMSNTPLDSSSIDVAVFCLSLMGTNFPSFLQEAHRVLKQNGWLLIAEVRSRFDPNNGGADPDSFSKAVCDLGFTSVSKVCSSSMKPSVIIRGGKSDSGWVLVNMGSFLSWITTGQDFSNKMFILLYFRKKPKNNSSKEIKWPELKPCIYKRR